MFKYVVVAVWQFYGSNSKTVRKLLSFARI
jgi:hypothetical protein